MQFQLSAVRSKVDFDIQGELPSRNIDTGMGLERMAILLQGVDNIYEIDTMWKVLDRAAELTDQKYGRDPRTDVSLRVDRGPRQGGGHAGGRRRDPVQRGTWLRASPHRPAQRPGPAAARRAASAAATGAQQARRPE